MDKFEKTTYGAGNYLRQHYMAKTFIAKKKDIQIFFNASSDKYEMLRAGRYITNFSKAEYNGIWKTIFE